MSEPFDPYHRWLGIAQEERPVSHYRLLGLKQFEADADVIESAADRQMAHVRSFQSGEHSAYAQQLLNELSTAKLVLLKPEEKTAYDAQLKAKPNGPAKVREPKMAKASPLDTIPATGAPPKRPPPKSIPTSAASSKSVVPILALLVAVPLLLFLVFAGGAVAYLTIFGAGDDTVALYESESRKGEVLTPPLVATSNNPDPRPVVEPNPKPNEPAASAENPIDEPPVIAEPEPPIAIPHTEPANSDDGELVAQAPENQIPIANGPQKHPVPGKAARDAARAKIDNIFSLDEADTREKKAALVQQLLKVAGDTKEDSVAKFVLLNMARELAAENAQARLAMHAVDQLQAGFDFDTWPVRMATLGAAVKSPVAPTEKREVIAVGIEMIDTLMHRDDYETAGSLAVAMLDIARRARDKTLLEAVVARRTRAAELLTSYKSARSAFELLKADPDNVDANLTAGKFYLFAKADWDRALPLLAKGSDKLFATAATAEITKPDTAAEKHKLADTWWTLAEAQDDSAAKRLLQSRALAWYQSSVSDLSGLDKAGAQKRIRELADAGINPTDLALRDEVSRPPTRPVEVVPDAAPDGLVAHWTFDEGRGAIARDVAGGHHGTIKGGTWIRGIRGNALSFDGRDDIVLIPLTEAMNYEGDVTVAAWVRIRGLRPKRGENSFANILSRTTDQQSTFFRVMDRGEGHKYSAGSWKINDKAFQAYEDVPSTDVGQWVHLAATFTDGQWTLYRNGKSYATGRSNFGMQKIEAPWSIGGLPDGRDFFHGDIDDVRFYNRALSVEEVIALTQPDLGTLLTTRPWKRYVYRDGRLEGSPSTFTFNADGSCVGKKGDFVSGVKSWKLEGDVLTLDGSMQLRFVKGKFRGAHVSGEWVFSPQ